VCANFLDKQTDRDLFFHGYQLE